MRAEFQIEPVIVGSSAWMISSPLVTLPTAIKSSGATGAVKTPATTWIAIATVVILVLWRSEEHTSELQSLMRISYAVFCLKKKKLTKTIQQHIQSYDTSIQYNIHKRLQQNTITTSAI